MAGETLLSALAAAVVDVLATVPGLKAYDHPPRAFDELPALELLLPTIARTGLGEPESELGHRDWNVLWPLRLHVALDDPRTAAVEALELVGRLVVAFDTDPTLGNSPGVNEAKIVTAEAGYAFRDGDGNLLTRPRVVYDLQLGIHRRVQS